MHLGFALAVILHAVPLTVRLEWRNLPDEETALGREAAGFAP